MAPKKHHGFTLVEVIIVMALFMTVIMVAAQTFKNIITQSAKYSKSEESSMEGIIGLELLRHDLEQMGFGLYWGYLPGSSINYAEAADADATTNDAPSNVPRAFVALNNSAAFSSDFMGIKGTTMGSSKASQRWSYIPFHNFSSSPSWSSRPVNWAAKNLMPGDRTIVIRHNFNDPTDDHLLLDTTGTEYTVLTTGSEPTNPYLPLKDQQLSMVYGIDQSSVTLRMPFNRADFFITTDTIAGKSVPPFCAEQTGVLYKAMVSHVNSGHYDYMPLLDCVAEMQVVLGWDISDGGRAKSISAYSNADGSVVAGGASSTDVQGWLASPVGIREHLKLVKVYILAQEGRKDPGYSYPAATMVVGNENNGETSLTGTHTFTTAQRQYHWKLYRVIARPKNLTNNQ